MAFEHSKIINLPTAHVTTSPEKKKNHLISTKKSYFGIIKTSLLLIDFNYQGNDDENGKINKHLFRVRDFLISKISQFH